MLSIGFCHRINQAFVDVETSLTELTKKDRQINVDKQDRHSFKTLKDMLKLPVLRLLNFNKLFILQVGTPGSESTLLHYDDDGPLTFAYAHRKLLSREKNYSAIEGMFIYCVLHQIASEILIFTQRLCCKWIMHACHSYRYVS